MARAASGYASPQGRACPLLPLIFKRDLLGMLLNPCPKPINFRRLSCHHGVRPSVLVSKTGMEVCEYTKLEMLTLCCYKSSESGCASETETPGINPLNYYELYMYLRFNGRTRWNDLHAHQFPFKSISNRVYKIYFYDTQNAFLFRILHVLNYEVDERYVSIAGLFPRVEIMHAQQNINLSNTTDSVCRMFRQKLCFQSPKTFTPKINLVLAAIHNSIYYM